MSRQERSYSLLIDDNPLGREFHFLSLFQFALPSIGMMLFMGLYTITDTVFVARFVHSDALSALNIVCPMINLIVGLASMLASGGSAVIAGKMGAGKSGEARADFSLLVLTGGIAGILIAVLGILFLEPLIWTLGASQRLFPYCMDYLFWILVFAPANILQVLFQILLITAGRPGMGLSVVIAGGLTNVLLDGLFLAGLGWGIQGAALGTGIGSLIPAVFGMIFFARSKKTLRFSVPGKDFRMLGASCFNGSSEMVSQLSTAAATYLFNRIMMERLGEEGVAAVTILIYTQFLFHALMIGFSAGVAPVISYRNGSGAWEELKRILKGCLIWILILSVLVFFIARGFGDEIAAMFSPRGTAVYEIAAEGFHTFAFAFLLCGYNLFFSSMFTALSNGLVSALLSFLRTFGLITANLLLLPNFLGVLGIWLAVPLAELCTLALSAGFAGRFYCRLLRL